MSYSSRAHSDYMDRVGEALENSVIETYIADAVDTITAAHGAEIANEVEGHLIFSVTLSDYLVDVEGHLTITEDVYMLPGVSRLIENMTEDYAA